MLKRSVTNELESSMKWNKGKVYPVTDHEGTVGTHCIGGWVGPQGRSEQMRKISPPTWIRSPDRPTHSVSPYLLLYPAHEIKQIWPNLKWYAGSFLEVMREAVKNFSPESRFPGQNFVRAHPEYKAGLQNITPRCSVTQEDKHNFM